MLIRHHSAVASPPTIYVGRIVHSISLDILEIHHRAALGVHPNGTIAFLDAIVKDVRTIQENHADNGFGKAVVVELTSSQLLMPGLIDTHLHAPQWPNLALGMDGNLREWIEEWTDPIEASYEDVKKAIQVYPDVVRTTLRLGSTTVAYNSSLHVDATKVLAETCWRLGQRAIVGKMCVTMGSTKGNWEKSTTASISSSVECIKFIRSLDPHGRLVRPCVQPRGGPYCPPELMKALGEQCKDYNVYVQGHMCETKNDIDRTLLVHKGFDCYSEMYRANGLLNQRSIMAHCIHLAARDFRNLKDTCAGVAHNPNSNTCLRDGECPVRELLDYGIKVGLGTDCSAGYMPSVQSAIRAASNVSRHLALSRDDARYILKFNELFYLATLGGASVVGLEHEVGNFEPGKQFDALLIDAKDVISIDASLSQDHSNDEAILKKWVFLGDDRNIRRVFVRGKLVAGHDAL